MALDFDNFPVYDDLVKSDGKSMSDIWKDFMATFIQTLTGYLSQNGMFVPQLTAAQRNSLQNLTNGQTVYNVTIGRYEGWQQDNWVPLSIALLSTTLRDLLITNPGNGEIIYNTTLNKYQGWENGSWVTIA